MKVTLSKHAGFCPGVRRADVSVNELLSENKDAVIYTLGNLIHNRLYNEALERRGVKSIRISDVPSVISNNTEKDVYIVIRTHGITKEDNEFLLKLEERHANLHIVDMTCPYVKKIHHIAEENTDDSTVFLLYCDPNHPEAVGIISYAHGEKYTFSSLEELKLIKIGKKTPVICSQTTQNLKEFKNIKIFFKKLYTNSIFFDTICSVTENRQNEAIKIAEKSDVMIVIGGRDSSNTHRLFELCREVCSDTRWIESYEELLTDFPDSAQSVGITAGASTPDGIITEVLKLWKKTKK